MLIEYGVWVARLAVAAVFGLSAAGKAADPAGTRKAVGEFGIPLRWSPAVAWALPISEGAVAVAILPPWTALAAAVVAAVLLVIFTGAILRLLRQGRHPECSCFGATSSTPIGRRSVLRNALLLALIGVAAVGSAMRPRVPAGLPVDRTVGTAVVAVLITLGCHLFTELRALRRRVDAQLLSGLGAEGLPTGAVAPEFDVAVVADTAVAAETAVSADTAVAAETAVTLAALLSSGRALLLVFVHPACEMCAALARELPRWQRRGGAALTVAVIGNGTVPEYTEWGRDQGLLTVVPILVQQGNEVALRYRVRGTPSGILIDPSGRIAAPVARGAMAIRELIVTAEAVAPPRNPARNGAKVLQSR